MYTKFKFLQNSAGNELSFISDLCLGVRTNVPSWCDRVLWKSFPDTHIVCRAYGCTNDIVTSDHSPVFAAFQVGVRGQYVSNEGKKSTFFIR